MKYQIYFKDLSEAKQALIFHDLMRVLTDGLIPSERPEGKKLVKMAEDHIKRHDTGCVWDIWTTAEIPF